MIKNNFLTKSILWWRLLLAVVVTGITVAGHYAKAAAPYPNKPIHLIVPFSAGSATDTLGRALAEQMARRMGQPFVVENRPGAIGTIGANVVATAPADGYTLLLGTQSTNAAPLAVLKSVPYDPAKDFSPISFVGVLPQVFLVNNDLPVHSISELIAYAKNKSQAMTYAWTSTLTRVCVETLARARDIQFLNVPYKAGSTALMDVISGRVDFTVVDTIVALPQIQAGKVRAIAVTSASGVDILPDVPTVAQGAGIADYEYTGIFAMFGPAGLPPGIVTTLSEVLKQVGTAPELRKQFAPTGLEIQMNSPEELRVRFDNERIRWTQAVSQAEIEKQ